MHLYKSQHFNRRIIIYNKNLNLMTEEKEVKASEKTPEKNSEKNSSKNGKAEKKITGDKLKQLTPSEIVTELDKYIIGQHNAKKSVAIALRNRWRRQQVPDSMKDEIMPNNIIMIGPTGVGKTEIARRISKLSNAPFIKVE